MPDVVSRINRACTKVAGCRCLERESERLMNFITTPTKYKTSLLIDRRSQTKQRKRILSIGEIKIGYYASSVVWCGLEWQTA